jgi:Skp family chaperone for outer membrane proteins
MKMPRLASFPPRLFLGLLLAPVLSAASDSIESVEQAATEWVKTRAEAVRLETEWASQRELLESTVKAFSERAQAIEEKRDNLKAKTVTDRTELATAQEKNQAAADRMQAVDARLKETKDKLNQLRPSLPPRLSEALELPYRSLAGTELGPAERMQITMTVLNRCAQFNRLVTCGQEVLTIEGEPGPKSFEVIYWGLSRGYALDRAAGKVWLGSPGPKGWQWEPHPEAIRQVAQLIAVFNDKAEPEFVAAPAKLGHVATVTSNQ